LQKKIGGAEGTSRKVVSEWFCAVRALSERQKTKPNVMPQKRKALGLFKNEEDEEERAALLRGRRIARNPPMTRGLV